MLHDPDLSGGLEEDPALEQEISDDLLRLMFIACHPVLSMDARAARGGRGFSGRGVSGNLPVQYSNRRTEIHEEAKTKPLSVIQGAGGPGRGPG